MKPNPFASLNHLTFPCSMAATAILSALNSTRDPRQKPKKVDLRRFSLTHTKQFVYWVHGHLEANASASTSYGIRVGDSAGVVGPGPEHGAGGSGRTGRRQRLHHGAEADADHGRKGTGRTR